MLEIARQGKEPIIIVGPCAAENELQVRHSADTALGVRAAALRACLTKPRTSPGWDGIDMDGVPLLAEAAARGLTVASEVKSGAQVHAYVEGIRRLTPDAQLYLWIGARSIMDATIRDIAGAVSQHRGIELGIKNPMHADERAWLGAADHALAAGISSERLSLIHRGFFMPDVLNPRGLRNVPDWRMAMRVREKTGLPMFNDPSHEGGKWNPSRGEASYSFYGDGVNRHPVIDIISESMREADFDGHMIEAHPRPDKALSDEHQQLPLEVVPRVALYIREHHTRRLRTSVHTTTGAHYVVA